MDLRIPGPWRHRDISANGIRLHIAEAGEGPLVVLLHGFPQLWWMWRHHIPALAEAGYHVVAPDLRGFGGSDKPPRSYDLITVAGDLAGLIRALGEHRAAVVGHDIGGLVGWTAAATHPDLISGLCAISAPHPSRLRAEIVKNRHQRNALGHLYRSQLPRAPESRLTKNHAAEVDRLMRKWSGAQWRDTTDFALAVSVYREAMCLPQSAYGAAEYFRWMMRSLVRSDGASYQRAMRPRLSAPVLQLHGDANPMLLAATATGSQSSTTGEYHLEMLTGIGHFVPEEAPEAVAAALVPWLAELS